jgi:hypothetical protein
MSETFAKLKKSEFKRAALSPAIRGQVRQIEYMSKLEYDMCPVGDVWVFDSETYKNFFYLAFMHVKSKKVITFEISDCKQLDYGFLQSFLWRFCIVGFNSINYDLPIIALAMREQSTQIIKQASDEIILENMNVFAFEKMYSIKVPKYNHIDLIQVAPLQASLKTYAGRIHCERMQDLPISPDETISEEDAEVIRYYCVNDLHNTRLLYLELLPHLQLRESMGRDYGIELRSKSDAQIAEAVINSELAKLLGSYPRKPDLSTLEALRYNLPAFVRFTTPSLCSLLETVLSARFDLDATGSPIMPKSIEKLTVKIGRTIYKLGMGGLHSTEKSVSYFAGDDETISDNDVESFYPRIILNQKLFPAHLGEAFLKVYEMLVNKRLDAKRNKLKIIADALKIVINGSFGKLGNKYSTLYSPQLMLQVTITGQLVLLMLIEMLENISINVVSGNTDGVVSYYKTSRHSEVRAVIAAWELQTSFKTEETQYASIHNRDVNNYIAVKKDGQTKCKGVYSEVGSTLNSPLSKNPETLICSDAVQAYIVGKIPLEKTITECNDIRRFVSVKNVKGGAEKNGVYLGKVVRWYYAKLEAGCIRYVMTGNKVGKTDNAKPLMDLPSHIPNDIDYSWYVQEATDMLYDLGILTKAKQTSLW